MIEVSDAIIEPATALEAFQAVAIESGAIATFTGQVRPQACGKSVKALHLQAYHPMTENGIHEAVKKAQRNWPLDAVHIRHRIGTMMPNETIVFVATASCHRRGAFEAADFLMDYLKTEAVFWKKETTSAGDTWIEPRADDYTAHARWSALEKI